MTNLRPIAPEQALAKDAMRAWLVKHPHMMLSDIARETCIPLTSLFYWVNGVTCNFKTPAYVQAVEKWMKAHDHD
jgi:hypothetical protein